MNSLVQRDPPRRSVETWQGQTYYDEPPLKHSHWDWKVGTYIAIGGMAGAAQLLALLARRGDRESADLLRRQAAVIGTGGAAIGAALLIVDLRTPHRFANMLRILRPTSPMSIGTYILSAFGASSALGLAADMLPGPNARRVAEAAQVPAAIAGAGMSVYTAALLSATSTPAWAAAPAWLGLRFASASMASGAAALSLGARLGGEEEAAGRLDRVAMLAAAAGAAATLGGERQLRARGQQPREGAIAAAEAAPAIAYAAAAMLPRIGRTLSILASLAAIGASIAMRNRAIRSGNASADRPGDYFRLAQSAGRHGGAA